MKKKVRLFQVLSVVIMLISIAGLVKMKIFMDEKEHAYINLINTMEKNRITVTMDKDVMSQCQWNKDKEIIFILKQK